MRRLAESMTRIKQKGRLRLAVVTTAKYFVPRLLGPFCSAYPGIEVTMEVINRDRLLERLARNADDLYVMGLPPEGWDIESNQVVDSTPTSS